jgi:CRP/FNR family cyclic AMP-dependent transcriptional regulator
MALQIICFARTRESPFIVESISRKPYEKRLARLLLLLANFGKDDKPEPIIAKQPGDTCGDDRNDPVTREFFMNKFRKLGFIHYNGGIEVHSSL